MKTRMRLLIRYAYFFEATWKELEQCLSKSRYVLMEELNIFLKGEVDTEKKVNQILEKINQNEMKKGNS